MSKQLEQVTDLLQGAITRYNKVDTMLSDTSDNGVLIIRTTKPVTLAQVMDSFTKSYLRPERKYMQSVRVNGDDVYQIYLPSHRDIDIMININPTGTVSKITVME